MKKLILLSLAAVMIAGCVKRNKEGEPILDKHYNETSVDNPHLEIIDSCEYICWNYRMAHKGNCRFCEERRNQELRELIKELKEK